MVTYDEIKDCALLAELWKKKGTKRGIHSSWCEFLDSEGITLLKDIEKKIGSDAYTPDTDKVLRFLTTDLDSMKICILGQDPYPQKGVATGRAFEVGGLEVWPENLTQRSLQNIVRLIYKNHKDIVIYEKIKSYNDICKEINSGAFPLLQPDRLFDSLEEQGVLFLNTYLTFRSEDNKDKNKKRKNAHEKFWKKQFTGAMLEYISRKRPDMIWFLWGSKAQKNKKYIKESGEIYECAHPMMCYKERRNDFLESDCFEKTRCIVDWTGKE